MFKILFILIMISLPLNADQYDLRLKDLFNQLLETEDDKEIERITINIWDIWHETNDMNIKADFVRGVGLMNNGNIDVSVNYFTRVIKNNPNFAEAWNKRATAHFMMGNFDLSMQDISQTLNLEPRHFGALDGMSLIFIHTNQYEKAIEIYDKMLEIFPYSISTQIKKEKMLSMSNKST